MSDNICLKRTRLCIAILSVLSPGLSSAVGSAQVNWVGESDYWDVPSNWSTSSSLPRDFDDAILNVGGSHIITIRSNGGPVAVNSVNAPGDEALAIDYGGDLTLVGASTPFNTSGESSIAGFSQSGGAVQGAGNLTVTGNANISSGTHNGSGTTTLKGDSSITYLNLDQGRILRNEGNVTWEGEINLNASDTGGSGRIDNAAGATWNAQGYGNLYATNHADASDLAGFPTFNNAGTFTKSGDANPTIINVAFNNNGSVNVQQGILNLNGGGTHGGSLAVGAGAELDLSGEHHLNAGSTLNVNGTLAVGGSVTSDIAANIAGTTRIDYLGNLALNQAWQTNGLQQNGGSVQGGNLTVTGNANISSGAHSGSGTTTLKGDSSITYLNLDQGRILRNEGNVTWEGEINLNASDTGGSGRIDNAAGATWNAQGYGNLYAVNYPDVSYSAGFPAFNNAGTFTKSGDANPTIINVAFNNTGSVNVQQGILNLNGGGTHGGSLAVGAGAELDLSGEHHLNVGSTLNVNGTLAVGGSVTSDIASNIAGTTRIDYLGNLALNQAWQTNGLQQNGGSVQGGNLTVTGNANISSGAHSGNGTTTLKGDSSITYLNLDQGRILRNEGNVTWEGEINLNASNTGGSGRIDNAAGATWNAQGYGNLYAVNHADASDLAGFQAFNNAGTFTKSGNANTTTVNVAFNNTGSVKVQQGTLLMAGQAIENGLNNQGSISVNAGATFQISGGNTVVDNHGTLTGNGTFDVGYNNTVNNFGVIDSGLGNEAGNLTFNLGSGSIFNQQNGAILAFGLGSLTAFDTLTIQGNDASVNLDGTLRISSLGGYNPEVGEIFTILNLNVTSINGAFDNIVAEGFNPSIRFIAEYQANSVVLKTSAVPLPASFWMMVSGLGLMAARRRKVTLGV